MGQGRLVAFEGTEGAGKSTQLRRLAAHGEAFGVPVRVVREPGETALGAEIRRLLLDPAGEMTARAEALLFMASRAELVETIVRPSLAAGTLVLCDRFFLSTYAYQAAGRGLPLDEIVAANRLATAGLVPDLTLVLKLDAAAGLARAAARGAQDRMERAGSDFMQRVGAAFDAALSPAWQAEHPEVGPVVAVDADADEDTVFARVLGAMAPLVPALSAAATR
jgi:dTMP kinase